MLFKFKSKAASDLIMLEADARRLLKIILGDDPVQGIVVAKNLPAAIVAIAYSAVAEPFSFFTCKKYIPSGTSPKLIVNG